MILTMESVCFVFFVMRHKLRIICFWTVFQNHPSVETDKIVNFTSQDKSEDKPDTDEVSIIDRTENRKY